MIKKRKSPALVHLRLDLSKISKEHIRKDHNGEYVLLSLHQSSIPKNDFFIHLVFNMESIDKNNLPKSIVGAGWKSAYFTDLNLDPAQTSAFDEI